MRSNTGEEHTREEHSAEEHSVEKHSGEETLGLHKSNYYGRNFEENLCKKI